MKTKLDLSKYPQVGTLKELVADANKDSDAASVFWMGDCINHADGLVIVVKGYEASLKAYSLLCNHGLVTAEKPVVEPQSASHWKVRFETKDGFYHPIWYGEDGGRPIERKVVDVWAKSYLRQNKDWLAKIDEIAAL